MSVLKHCLRLAVEWGLLNESPGVGARLAKLPAGRTRYPTPGELKAGLDAAAEWLRAPMAFALMRSSSFGGICSHKAAQAV